MPPEHLRFGGGTSQTILSPVVAAAVLIASILILCLPRKRVITPFLVACILIPTDQVLLLGGLHFPMQRVLIVAAVMRFVRETMRSRLALFGSGGFNRLDLVTIALPVVVAINSVLLWQESGALINQLGELYTILGTYLFLRFCIRNKNDVVYTINVLVWIAVIIALVMIREQMSGKNPYAILGGARSLGYVSAVLRDGRFRAEGCFAQPILAGSFGAILLPLFIGLGWASRGQLRMSVLGAAAASTIVITSNSSTPLLAYSGGVLALLLWPLRKKMRLIRWALLSSLISLHLVMKAPVWHLISRVDVSGGSDAYHRYVLIDQCIRHFSDWWLIGTKSSAEWGWDMWDTANQYVGTGECSGLIALLLFLAVITLGFKGVGKARRATRSRRDAILLWCLGGALFTNVIAFFGVSYFDQTVVAWYTLLAMISAAAIQPTRHKLFAGGGPTLASNEHLLADPTYISRA